ncbi:MAG: 3-methyl-2-oxobutanoate hydroxymethyltransferase [Deltaproteobacteria bacterium]
MTIAEIQEAKGKRKLTMLTAYDYPMALAVERARIDMVLVGDSVANVVLGLESTRDVTMDQMIYHAQAVRRAVKKSLVIGDMPFEAYQKDATQSVRNAGRFIKEAGCDAVKLEWFGEAVSVAKAIVRSGVPVMGHIGLTPQTAKEFKVQGKDAQAARHVLESALALESAGCFSVLMECVPDRLAALITKRLRVPTIGIGAGPDCDGQVLVTHDLLGLFDRGIPRFVKKYEDLLDCMVGAFNRFRGDVESGRFPDKEHSYGMSEEELRKLEE